MAVRVTTRAQKRRYDELPDGGTEGEEQRRGSSEGFLHLEVFRQSGIHPSRPSPTLLDWATVQFSSIHFSSNFLSFCMPASSWGIYLIGILSLDGWPELGFSCSTRANIAAMSFRLFLCSVSLSVMRGQRSACFVHCCHTSSFDRASQTIRSVVCGEATCGACRACSAKWMW